MRFSYLVSALFFEIYSIVTILHQSWAGWCLMLALASLAIAFRSNNFLKGFTFTLTIMATVSTLLAPFLTPLIMRWLAGSFIEVHWQAMVWDITKMVIFPVIAGLLFHYLVRGRFKGLDRAMPVISMGGIALIIVVITAAGRDSLLKVGVLLVLATLLHNSAGYFLGYWAGRLMRFHERDCRTIALEVGMQNSGLASASPSRWASWQQSV